MTKAPETTRRGFLGAVAGLLGAIPIIGGIFVAARVGLTPMHADKPARLPLCRPSEVVGTQILERPLSYQMRRGPAVENVSSVVFVTRDPSDPSKFLALSGECTHLGCPVQNKTVAIAGNGDAAPLQCPCHGGKFSRTGEVLDGPPPRPLRRLKIEMPSDPDGMIHVTDL